MIKKVENKEFDKLINAKFEVMTDEKARFVVSQAHGISSIEDMEYTDKEKEIAQLFLTGKITKEEYEKAFCEANK